jgi:hypothetical protein
MREKDLTEGPISALKSLGRAAQQGLAKGYTATRPGGVLGPDAAQNAIANLFDPKSGGKAEPIKDKKKDLKKEPQQPEQKSSTYVFQDEKGDVYSYDADKKFWVSADGSKKIKKSSGARLWAKASKRYPEGNVKFTEDNTMKKVQEGLADLADAAEKDHEVQMARAELYKIAKYGIQLHDMLKNVSEAEGLEGWVQSKITKAADYLGSVYHHMDYEMKFGESVTESVNDCDETCPKSCPDCGGTGDPEKFKADQKNEGKSPHKKGSKKYKAHMAAMHAESAKDEYKSYLRYKLAERTLSKDETKKKEKYVKGMKKAKGDFKDRYGKDAEAVMYATATKMAKKK